jgi:methylenetetrahydrofolate dehydrogenase (NADP+)/methenyltetrahydrofolate cyclohydrolase
VAARILDGKAIAAGIESEIATRVKAVREAGVIPTLVAVLVGDDPASQVYVRNKHKACERVGMGTRVIALPASTSQSELLKLVQELNADAGVHGILVQLPLPKHIDTTVVLDAVDPAKDVDAFHPHNVGLISQGRPRFLPCTPHGVMQILARSQIEVAGKHAAVLGRSDIVGKPMAMLLTAKDGPGGPGNCNATVTICHSRTKNLPAILREADIVIAAIGVPRFVTAEMIKPGAVVIDVGINRVDGKLCGDVDFESVANVAGAITPVPGGVGPLTIVMLLENTVRAAELTL